MVSWHERDAASYGAAGSLIVLLLWVFYSSSIFLFGAEVTRAYATFGTRADLSPMIQPTADTSIASSPPSSADGRASVAIAAVAFVSALTATITSSAFKRREDRD